MSDLARLVATGCTSHGNTGRNWSAHGAAVLVGRPAHHAHTSAHALVPVAVLELNLGGAVEQSITADIGDDMGDLNLNASQQNVPEEWPSMLDEVNPDDLEIDDLIDQLISEQEQSLSLVILAGEVRDSVPIPQKQKWRS